MLSLGEAVAGGQKQGPRADRGVEDRRQHARMQAVRDHARDAGFGRLVGGIELGRHPASSHCAARAADKPGDLRGDVWHERHQAGIGAHARVGGVQAVDVAQNHEQIGIHEHGREGREVVIVAEVEPHLVNDHRIVLVDHWDHAGVEQRFEGVAGIQVPSPAREVIVGQENLCHVAAACREVFLVERHEADLADGGGGLFLGDGLRTGLQAKPGQAGGNGAGADQDDLVIAVEEGVDLRDQAL